VSRNRAIILDQDIAANTVYESAQFLGSRQAFFLPQYIQYAKEGLLLDIVNRLRAASCVAQLYS
jgi:hypothetical protein